MSRERPVTSISRRAPSAPPSGSAHPLVRCWLAIRPTTLVVRLHFSVSPRSRPQDFFRSCYSCRKPGSGQSGPGGGHDRRDIMTWVKRLRLSFRRDPLKPRHLRAAQCPLHGFQAVIRRTHHGFARCSSRLKTVRCSRRVGGLRPWPRLQQLHNGS